jgi:hypothetical protein
LKRPFEQVRQIASRAPDSELVTPRQSAIPGGMGARSHMSIPGHGTVVHDLRTAAPIPGRHPGLLPRHPAGAGTRRLAARTAPAESLNLRNRRKAWTMSDMQQSERILVHQVHPAKLGADITASVLSDILLWTARPNAALAVRVLLPIAGSFAVLRLADLDALARTRRGHYVLTHMPPSAQAVRLAGDALMGWGAYRHSVPLLLGGVAVVAAGWSHPAWPRMTRTQGPGRTGAGRPEPGTRTLTARASPADRP